MTRKQRVLKAVKSLPKDASYADAIEQVLFLAKIEKGLAQADAGRTLSHEKVKRKLKKWLR